MFVCLRWLLFQHVAMVTYISEASARLMAKSSFDNFFYLG